MVAALALSVAAMLRPALPASDIGDGPVAIVERTPRGSLVLRHPTWLIYLHPQDWATFSPHVGRVVTRSVSGYRENNADRPPEPVAPGDVFSTSGIRLVKLWPDPGLSISVGLERTRYQVGEPVLADVRLRNVSRQDLRLEAVRSEDPHLNRRIRAIIWVRKIGKWDKPAFHDLLYTKSHPLLLRTGQSLGRKDIDVSAHLDGPGTYRVSAQYPGSYGVYARFVEFVVAPKADGNAPRE